MLNSTQRESTCLSIRLPAQVLLILLVTIWSSVSGAEPEQVVLAEAGRARFRIVVPKQPTRPLNDAANELAEYLGRISGAAFEVATESGDLTPFYLGDCDATRELGIDARRLDPEGFLIVLRPDVCAIVGRIPSPDDDPSIVDSEQVGVWHGVHRFLEDLGVRWLWPGELGEVIPWHDRLTVLVGEVIDAPRLARRGLRNRIMTDRLYMEGERWLQRMRIGSHVSLAKGHAFQTICKKYAETHPEILGGGDLCVSNPKTLEIVVDELIRSRPVKPYDSVSIASADTSVYCSCENCRALDTPGRMMKADYGWLSGSEDPVMTDRYVHFWNQIAREAEKTHPNLKLCVYSYMVTMPPPVREKLHPNIFVWSVLFWDYMIRGPADQAKYRRWWAGWNEAGAHEMILRPNFLWYSLGLPVVFSQRFVRDFHFCYRHGLIGTDIDALQGHFAARGPMLYLFTRLFWDPAANADHILADFYHHAFGPAARSVRQYYGLCEQVTDRIAAERFLDHSFFYAVLADYYDEDFLSQAEALLSKARAEAGANGLYRKRVDFVALGLRYVMLQSRINRLMQKGILSADEQEQFLHLYEEREEFFDEIEGEHALNVKTIRRMIHGANVNGIFGLNLYEDLKSAHTVAMLPIEWKIRFDPEGVGDGRWFLPQDDLSAWVSIRVSLPWEAQGHPDYNGVAWYRVKFDVPEKLEGQRLALKFNAVDNAADVWVNAQRVGEYRGHRKKPFEMEVTDLVHYGKTNEVVVRVIDSSGQGGVWKRVWLKRIEQE